MFIEYLLQGTELFSPPLASSAPIHMLKPSPQCDYLETGSLGGNQG